MGDDRLLRIYMADQLALGVLWREIARRAHKAAGATAEQEAIGNVAAAIAEDVLTFRQIMRRLGFGTRTPKNAMAVVAVVNLRKSRRLMCALLSADAPGKYKD